MIFLPKKARSATAEVGREGLFVFAFNFAVQTVDLPFRAFRANAVSDLRLGVILKECLHRNPLPLGGGDFPAPSTNAKELAQFRHFGTSFR